MVGLGSVHSTDTLIEATGDYNGHFAKMVESGNWSAHGKMHHKNFVNAKEDMKLGVTPVVIDNTGLRLKEVENYIIKALELGFNENNIKIIDVGLGGQTVETLAERNTHNVPLATIKRMVQTYNSVGEITVSRVLENYLKRANN